MYTNNAYLNNSTVDRKDKSKPLVITMCGTYKLYTKPKLPTWRPRGRLDFQLLYIAAGKAHFHFDNNDEETIVHAGLWFYIVQKNHKNTNITQKIKLKFTGFTLLETMSRTCFVLMDLLIKKFFTVDPVQNIKICFVL